MKAKNIIPMQLIKSAVILGLSVSVSLVSLAQNKKAIKDNSRTSLDWDGSYSNGSETINLFKDNSYLNTNGSFMQSGKFVWATNGGNITINAGKQFKVMEGKLKNTTNGEEFSKIGSSVSGELTPVKVDARLLGGKWELVEIDGKTVEKNDAWRKTPFLAFDGEKGGFYGHGGCNGFSGSLKKMDEFKIEFGPAMQTMMACLGAMDIETSLGKVLQNADNYTVNDGFLSLNKARMRTLAKFKLVK